jgi:uncharacterized membrane protein YbhN (UPF0104 family)
MFIGGILGKQSMFVLLFRKLRLHQIKRLSHVELNLAKIEKEIETFYRTRTEYFHLIVLLIVLLWGLMFLEYRFALQIVGHDATPLQIFLILTGVGLAYAVPIPAAMGVLELGQLSATKVLNLSGATGIALAFLVRTRDLLWSAIGLCLLPFYRVTFKKLSKTQKEIDRDFEQGDLYKRRT